MIRALFVAFFVLLPSIGLADNISLLGVDILSKPNASDSHYAAKSYLGAGIFDEHAFSTMFALELGLIYGGRRYQNDTNTMQYTQKMLEIPLLFRVYLGSQLAIGIGIYDSVFLGNYETINLGANSSTTSSYTDAGLTKNDFGAFSSLSFFQPLGKNISGLVEVQDNVGIKNNRLDPSLPKLHVNDVQILLGARLEL